MIQVVSDMNTTNIQGLGIPIKMSEVVTDSVLDYVEGFNPDLGSASDEYFLKYKNFLETVGSREYDIIKASDIAANEYKTYDISESDDSIKNLNIIKDFIKIIGKSIKNSIGIAYAENPANIINYNGEEYIRSPYKITIKDLD